MPQASTRQMAKMAKMQKGMIKIKILAASMRKKGKSIRKIAVELHTPSTTVYDWLLKMHGRGPKGIFDKRRRGRNRILDNNCLKKLKKWLTERPEKYGFVSGSWQLDTILELVKIKTGLVCSKRTLRRVLRKIHKSYRKLNPVPHNSASEEQQEKFKEETSDRLENSRMQGHVIFTFDEGTIQMHSNNGYGWRSTNGGDTLPTRFTKKAAKMFCAVREGKLHVWTADATNSGTFVEALKKLHMEYPKITMIPDNAAYHKSQIVKDYIESIKKDPYLDLELIFLPPYTPQLNPTEIQIREIKKELQACHLIPWMS